LSLFLWRKRPNQRRCRQLLKGEKRSMLALLRRKAEMQRKQSGCARKRIEAWRIPMHSTAWDWPLKLMEKPLLLRIFFVAI
jgi:hypothetical protein